jgi:hypothetical protein
MAALSQKAEVSLIEWIESAHGHNTNFVQRFEEIRIAIISLPKPVGINANPSLLE